MRGPGLCSRDFVAVHPGVAMKAEQVLPWIPLILVLQETGDTSKLNGLHNGDGVGQPIFGQTLSCWAC